MDSHQTLIPGWTAKQAADGRRARSKGCSRDGPVELARGALSAHAVDRNLHTGQPQDRTESRDAFGSVLCTVDRTADDQAARRQAELVASPERTIELVSASQLTRHGLRALHERCEGHDLLALGAGPAAQTAVQQAPIPILIARWCPLETEVADTILVPIDASPESSRAVELAGRLAAAHGGTVSILAAPPRDPALQRAVAASGRILLGATGAAPRVVGEQLPRQRSVPSAAATLTASLVVLGSGNSGIDRSATADIVGRLGCSVLVVFDAGEMEATETPGRAQRLGRGESGNGHRPGIRPFGRDAPATPTTPSRGDSR
jgi:nucleotide-binding universal stress UspA family protein